LQVVGSMTDWIKLRSESLFHNKSIGFVPTMGYLHQGHLSLMRKAREQNDLVVASIYVNPTQFVPGEDFEHYPRDEKRDLAMLEAEGVDYVITPSDQDIYPNGFSTYIEPPAASQGWCGDARPGHFRGVCTIISILFNLVRPDRVYLGRKDAQQSVVIRSMINDFRFPVEIVVCPIIREPDGLAMSSRNVYLSPEERKKALVLHDTLELGIQQYKAEKRCAADIISQGKQQIQKIDGVRLDYLGIVEQNRFTPVDIAQSGNFYIGAIYLGKTRLIDNLVFGQGGN